MAKKRKLNEAEWEIMEGVWHFDRPVTVREVHEVLYPQKQKAYTTVQTIMNILTDKGFLQREKRGKVNFYTPTLSRQDAARMETQNLVSRLFQGSFGALANYLINSGQLTEKDLQDIKALLDKKDRDA
ncbi:MAG: BlaI/MecI/CopY family transcriptional regulator [candidate division KSB1 bacterium]|nr:BlaI/MecI/CopY family transcriptional regulator [candidate division KSB1 bacterium]MDQ7064889.1 BlaI/MecI/CopY family transcriptional regulator [candidate division KSB1 bacterium]